MTRVEGKKRREGRVQKWVVNGGGISICPDSDY